MNKKCIDTIIFNYKRGEVLIHATTRMHLGNIVLRGEKKPDTKGQILYDSIDTKYPRGDLETERGLVGGLGRGRAGQTHATPKGHFIVFSWFTMMNTFWNY